MNDSTTSEISNLFQELIVSKIKDEIELLKKEIEGIKETNESCDDKVEKLPKSSSIRKIVESEQTKVIDLINEITRNSKSEKYLKDIVAYLKKQYAFSDGKTLCLILDEIQQNNIQFSDELIPVSDFVKNNNIESNLNALTDYVKEQCTFGEHASLSCFLEFFADVTDERIKSIIESQNSFAEKYDSIVAVLEQYRDDILVQIKANAESLDGIQKQLIANKNAIKSNSAGITSLISRSDDEMKLVDTILCEIETISQNSENTNTLLNEVLQSVGTESEIYELLRFITGSINNTEEKSEIDWTIKDNFIETNKRLEELLEINRLQDERNCCLIEKYEQLEKAKNRMIKLLIVGNVISVICVVGLVLMQIF